MTYIKNSKEPTKKHTMPKERSSPPTLVAPWIRKQQMIHSLWHFFFGSKFHYTSSFRKLYNHLKFRLVASTRLNQYLGGYNMQPSLHTYELMNINHVGNYPRGLDFASDLYRKYLTVITSSQSTKFFSQRIWSNDMQKNGEYNQESQHNSIWNHPSSSPNRESPEAKKLLWRIRQMTRSSHQLWCFPTVFFPVSS